MDDAHDRDGRPLELPIGDPAQPMDGSLVDLALGEGAPADQERLRGELAGDPLRAIEFAETRQLLERMRGLQVDASSGFAARLEHVIRQGEQRQHWRRASPRLWPQVLAVTAAAAALFLLLAVLDPLRLRTRGDGAVGAPPAQPMLAAAVPARAAAPLPATIARAWDATQRMLPDSRLVTAFDRLQNGGPRARLSQWLSPRNAVAVLRLEHELRGTADARRQALRARGHLAVVEDRVQDLCADLAVALLGGDADALPTEEMALTVRALIAAGGQHRAAIDRGAELLAARLPALSAGPLAGALQALGEVAAAFGSPFEAAVHEHGRRLVDEVVAVEGEIWSRRLPALLAWSTPATEVAAAGRFLRIAPAFGIDADQAMLVRLLLLERLQERRDPRNETPDLPAALVYGFGDLLSAADRDEVERRLRTWRPEALLPDFETLQQVAATRDPSCTGYARWQLDLRRVCAVPTPDGTGDRAALCLCLATSFGRSAVPAHGTRLVQG
ncbi:MAG: hypothetical protein AB7O97_15855 [Planctomycetota bacterium]